MSPSIIGAFELRTVDIQFDAKTTDKVPAHCYGDLAAYRIDSFVRRHNPDGLLAYNELWGVILLSNGCMFPLAPVFRTLDDAVGFIYGANLLCNSWARAGKEVHRRHHDALIALLRQFDGFPLVVLLDKLGDIKRNSEEPGIRMNLNGYRPDET